MEPLSPADPGARVGSPFAATVGGRARVTTKPTGYAHALCRRSAILSQVRLPPPDQEAIHGRVVPIAPRGVVEAHLDA